MARSAVDQRYARKQREAALVGVGFIAFGIVMFVQFHWEWSFLVFCVVAGFSLVLAAVVAHWERRRADRLDGGQ